MKDCVVSPMVLQCYVTDRRKISERLESGVNGSLIAFILTDHMHIILFYNNIHNDNLKKT